MLSWPCTLATFLFLVPVVVVLLVRSRKDRASWEIALDIPFAVSLDLMSVLTLCRVVTLERAVLASRVAWVAVGVFVLVRNARRGRPVVAWPNLPRRTWVAALLAAIGAFALSYQLSRPYAIWDRELHIPTVSSLRGQTMPFSTPYEPGRGFHYHFAGDALAATMQVLSFDTIHSSLALSLAHDVVFALTAASIAFLMAAFGFRGPLPIIFGSIAMLLTGPCVLHGRIGEPYLGYSYYASLIWGFRPHQHLASLLMVGFVGAVVVRCAMGFGKIPNRKTLPVLVAVTALLAITDEGSLGVLGLSLGLAWLADPRIVADSRRAGTVTFVTLAAVAIGVNLFFGAGLSPGGPVSDIAWVPFRSPGVQRPPLPLSTRDGIVALAADLLPTLSCALGAVLAMRGSRGRTAPVLVVFIAIMLAISTLGLTAVEVNHAPPESHRFATAALFIMPLFGLLYLARMAPDSFARLLVLGGLAASVSSTLLWLSHYSAAHCTSEAYFRQRGPTNLHQMDCRRETGVRVDTRPKPTYIDASLWYYFAGCYPVYSTGQAVSYWTTRMYPDLSGNLTDLDRWAGADSLDAVCPSSGAGVVLDRVCAYAVSSTKCSPQGDMFVRCKLAPRDRSLLMKGADGPA